MNEKESKIISLEQNYCYMLENHKNLIKQKDEENLQPEHERKILITKL